MVCDNPKIGVLLYRNGGVAYSYDFNKNPNASIYEEAVHKSDFSYHIGLPLLYGPYNGTISRTEDPSTQLISMFTDDELELSYDVITYFSNFVHSGYVQLPIHL